MALTKKCKECEREIPDQALSCPYCGTPVDKPGKVSIDTLRQLDLKVGKKTIYWMINFIFISMLVLGLIMALLNFVFKGEGRLIFWSIIGLIGFIGIFLNKN